MNTLMLLNRMNKLISELPEPNDGWRGYPEADSLNKFVEDKNSFTLKLNLAGAAKESVDVSFEDNMVIVLAEAEDDIKYHYKCHIPSKKINPKKAKAKYENGILELDMPKAEKIKPVSIKVD